MPQVTRLNDCCTGHDACPPRPLITASTDVFANDKGVGRAQLDEYDLHGCDVHSPHSAVISSGSPNVYVNDKQVGRIEDPVSCGGKVRDGSDNIIIN